jgi:hypothetical protein
MNATLRCRLVALAFCLVLAGAKAHAQDIWTAAGPAPAAPAAPEKVVVETPAPAPYVLPPAGQWGSATLPFPDPLLDRPTAPLPGWFVNVEPNVLAVHFRNQISVGVPLPGGGANTVNFPGPKLDATVSPRFEVGAHLADGWGDLFVGYRFINTQGGSAVLAGAGPGQATGRLALNAFDFGYAAQEFSLGPQWDLRWRTGARATILYYDARLNLAAPAPDQGLMLASEHEINFFSGVGPFVTLEIDRRTGIPGLEVFARGESSLQFGHISQTGVEDFVGPASEVLAKQAFEVTVLTLAEEVGVCYVVPEWNNSRFLLGYHYETYFQAGRFNFTTSRGQLDLQGVFLRAEFNF